MSKAISLLLCVLLLQATLTIKPSVACAGDKSGPPKTDALKVQLAVAKLGAGTDTLVQVKLRNKIKVSGFVESIEATSFTIVDPASGASAKVAYDDVRELRGHNLSTGAKVAIVIGIVVGALLILVLIGLHYSD